MTMSATASTIVHIITIPEKSQRPVERILSELPMSLCPVTLECIYRSSEISSDLSLGYISLVYLAFTELASQMKLTLLLVIIITST